ncbi:polymer-forming cytoskeletal protein [Candidatus Falkowbacteria bacterium]|nr:polymer-forming cytoskeletal protein [Candidatus Falkowbacteria bacterium]
MFSKDEKLKGKDIETIIGPSVKVKGEFNGQGDIIIDGFFEGTLKTAGSLFVGNKAKVQANIEARDGKISGEIIGNIKMKGFMEITSTAKISGDIEVNQISVEQGAVINGSLIMKKGTEGTPAVAEK